MDRNVVSFSYCRQDDAQTYNKFERLRGIMMMDRSEAIMKSIGEYIINHPIDKMNLITDYHSGKPPLQLPPVSLYTNFKELRLICNKMENAKLLALKEQAKKFIGAVDLEIESRVNR